MLGGAAASPEELAALTRRALAEAAADRLRPVIGQEFELAAAASAHAAIEARTTVGKTLLTVLPLGIRADRRSRVPASRP